jgi:putative NADH-flavin reductase
MIKELWQYVATSTELPVAKQMGFLKEAIAIDARAKRCHRQWDAHYLKCKETIVAATQRAVQKRTVLVFGAGSLNDIPLSYLSSQFLR